MTPFEEGVLYAASILVATHDVPVLAATILREAGLENVDCSGVDEYEKKSLRKINNEKGIELRGL